MSLPAALAVTRDIFIIPDQKDINVLSILYGITSAFTWGAGDFAGGLASRKLGAYRAVMYADFFGLLLVGIVFVFYRESIPSLPVRSLA